MEYSWLHRWRRIAHVVVARCSQSCYPRPAYDRYALATIESLPSIADGSVDWKPIQHYFQLTAFGMNVYRANDVGTQVIGDHDEAAGRHEEVYLVLEGRVDFAVEAETFECTPGTLVVIKDPTVRTVRLERIGQCRGAGRRQPAGKTVRIYVERQALARSPDGERRIVPLTRSASRVRTRAHIRSRCA